MKNQWAQPDGYEDHPPTVRYRIRGPSGRVVERRTAVAFDSGRRRYYHALAPEDQPFGDAIVRLIQGACSYFCAPDEEYEPLDGAPDIRLSDSEVAARIERLERGENTREAERTGLQYYPLTELPFDQQRALVEQIEALKQHWQCALIGEDAPEGSDAAAAPEATPWPRALPGLISQTAASPVRQRLGRQHLRRIAGGWVPNAGLLGGRFALRRPRGGGGGRLDHERALWGRLLIAGVGSDRGIRDGGIVAQWRRVSWRGRIIAGRWRRPTVGGRIRDGGIVVRGRRVGWRGRIIAGRGRPVGGRRILRRRGRIAGRGRVRGVVGRGRLAGVGRILGRRGRVARTGVAGIGALVWPSAGVGRYCGLGRTVGPAGTDSAVRGIRGRAPAGDRVQRPAPQGEPERQGQDAQGKRDAERRLCGDAPPGVG